MGRSRRKNGAIGIPSASSIKYTMPRKPADSLPKCVTDVNFLTMALESKACRPDLTRAEFAHYLVGEGKGPDGSLPPMFTREDMPPSDAFAKSWLRRDQSVDAQQPGFDRGRWPLNQAWCAELIRRELAGEKWHFRLMASPERHIGERIDMRDFARAAMQRVDEDLRLTTFWAASAHYNTDNPHVHISVRGISVEGRPVYFPSPYANRGFEYRCRQVLADLLAAQTKPGKQVLRAG